MKGLLFSHYLLMSAAFLTFGVSFLIGLVFLIQEFQLKHHRPTPSWLRRAPALEVIDLYHYKVLTFGFGLLTGGMILGVVLSHLLFGHYFSSDPRMVASLINWGIYALFLNVRIRAGWRGRRGIFLSFLGFATIVLIYFGIHHRGI